MAWLDNTGLYRKYGVEKTLPTTGGEYCTDGALREIEFFVDLTTLTQTPVILGDVTFMPKEMKIEEVEVYTDTAAADGAAINVGLIETDRSTEIDFDGILAAYPTASMNAVGEKVVETATTTYGGALLGVETDEVGYFCAQRTTATAFTAGKIRIRIRYSRLP